MTNNTTFLIIFLCGVMVCCLSVAETPWDYRIAVIDGGASSHHDPHVLETPLKGNIGYHHARPKAPALWFRFEGRYGDSLRLQLGVPALDKYRGLFPAVAVLTLNGPEIDETLPFAVPEGYGGYIYHAADLHRSVHTNNHAGVVSWRFDAIDHVLDSAGRTYVVGFIPLLADGEASGDYPDGKFWLTVGEGVNFRLTDLFGTFTRIFRVRAFHEDAVSASHTIRNSIVGLLIAVIATMLAVA